MQRSLSSPDSGFTYVELLVSLLIIGLVGFVLVEAHIGILHAHKRVREEAKASFLASSLQARHYFSLEMTSMVEAADFALQTTTGTVMVDSNRLPVTIMDVQQTDGRASGSRVVLGGETP